MFDADKFSEILDTRRPVVIIVNGGSVDEVYTCPLEDTHHTSALILDTETNTELNHYMNDITDILEEQGYASVDFEQYEDFIDADDPSDTEEESTDDDDDSDEED